MIRNSDGCWAECPPGRQGTGLLPEIPHALYLPENHAPGYAYPLVVYLHEDGRSEADLARWFPQVSDQNFIGLGIRAPFPSPAGIPGAYRWMQRRPDASCATVLDAVAMIRRDWNVHPKRIFLLGEGTGAVTALQHLILQQTRLFDGEERIAGAICSNLPENWPHRLPALCPGPSGRVLFIEKVYEAAEFAAIDALGEAGLEIAFGCEFQRTVHETVNHWLMSSVTGVVY